MTSAAMTTHWIPTGTNPSDIGCLCFGTGRFLRSVLVPALNKAKIPTALVQTRGRSFIEYMHRQAENGRYYSVDTVLPTGEIETDQVACAGAFSIGTVADKQAFYDFLPQLTGISVLGLGITEAGLASADTQVMKDLMEFLRIVKSLLETGKWKDPNTPSKRICILDMDNVPNNGSVLEKHMQTLASDDAEMKAFLNKKCVFLNTMVDRITSQREGTQGMVPRAEPVPAKALVILDAAGDLPLALVHLANKNENNGEHHVDKDDDGYEYGVVIRSTSAQLQADISLKLRIANGTHTAVAHLLALLGHTMTDSLALSSSSPSSNPSAALIMAYLDALFHDQISAAGAPGLPHHSPEAAAVYADWRKRLTHPHFGLSSFFITQNGPAKGGIRLGPTAADLMTMMVDSQPPQQAGVITVTMVFAFAVLLRWLTPSEPVTTSGNNNGIYTGWLQGSARKHSKSNDTATSEYADGLRYNLQDGWYEFRCACNVSDSNVSLSPQSSQSRPLSEWLGSFATARQPAALLSPIRAYLLAPDGGNLCAVAQKPEFETMVQAIATLYARMVAGDDMLALLQEMKDCQGVYVDGMSTDCAVLVDEPCLKAGRPLHYRVSPIPAESALLQLVVDETTVGAVVASEVASAIAIDLHTHLLPPSHGSLCLWGIDELLTYHYLVAEYFMTAPAVMTPEAFYGMHKKEQSDIIWKALFIDRSPISEACRGVITTLMALGLAKAVEARNLEAIRTFYSEFREEGLAGAEKFSELVFCKAGLRYNVMTNIPFDPNEAQHWRPSRKEYPDRYRSALRVDPLLSGDRKTIESALKGSGYNVTIEGARQYLRDWCDTMKPEYMMASTPHDFVLKEGTLADVSKTGVNEEAMKQPGAFADGTSDGGACNGTEDDAPSIIDENSNFLSQVLMKVCEERDLPVALKIGAHRGVNPELKSAGDGVVAFADAGMLGRLCSRFPKVRFLATFLSRNNQHEACVLASKFRNLHIYGCWWFCNNPSMIREITQMRLEMLGTAFTAQHSDARVLDQLVYKWAHSRYVYSYRVLVQRSFY
jgi:hypothetical protein